MWITENLIKSQNKINQKINKNANVQQNNETILYTMSILAHSS